MYFIFILALRACVIQELGYKNESESQYIYKNLSIYRPSLLGYFFAYMHKFQVYLDIYLKHVISN